MFTIRYTYSTIPTIPTIPSLILHNYLPTYLWFCIKLSHHE